MRIIRIGLLFFFTLLLTGFSWSQTAIDGTIRAIVVFAEGSEFSLFRNGIYTSLGAQDDKLLGLGLFSGDFIQTGTGTRLEIQFLPGTSRFDVAENTSFLIVVNGDEIGINLTYGRIKGRINDDGSKNRFSINSNLVTARTTTAEFGFDVLSSSRGAGGIQSQIYCLEGFLTLRVPIDGAATSSFESARLDTANTFIVYKGILPSDASADSRILGDTVFLSLKRVPDSIKAFWSPSKTRIQVSMPSTKQNDFFVDFRRIPDAQSKPEDVTTLVRTYLQGSTQVSQVDGQSAFTTETSPFAAKPLSLADQLEPLSRGEVFSIRQKPMVDQADLLKKAGLIVAGLGLAADLVGIGFYHFGNSTFGFELATSQSIGQITTISGSAVFATGLVMYFVGLFQ